MPDIVTGDTKPPTETPKDTMMKEYSQDTAKATAVVVLGLGDGPLKAVHNDTNKLAKLRTLLTTHYASQTTSKNLTLLKEVITVHCSSGMPLDYHVADLEVFFKKLSAAGHSLAELLRLRGFLSSLSGSSASELTIAAIRTIDETKATYEAVVSCLLDEANVFHGYNVAVARLVASNYSIHQRTGVHLESRPRVFKWDGSINKNN